MTVSEAQGTSVAPMEHRRITDRPTAIAVLVVVFLSFFRFSRFSRAHD